MTIEMILSAKDIEENIPYIMICTTRYGSVWNTMKRKLLWDKIFTNSEKESAEKLFKQSHIWFIKGVTNNVRIDFQTYRLWCKVAEFCYLI